MPKPYPKEFRDDVVAVARKGQAPLNQIAKDFGICGGCLHNWMKKAAVEDGHRRGPTDADRPELHELKKRNRLLEQENEGHCCIEPSGEAGTIDLPVGSSRHVPDGAIRAAQVVTKEMPCGG